MTTRTTRVRRLVLAAAVAVCAAAPVALVASGVSIPHAFSNSTVADATQVNANFAAVEAAVDDNDARLTAIEQNPTSGRVKFHRVYPASRIATAATNKDGTQSLVGLRYELTVGTVGRRFFDLPLVPAGTLSATKSYSVRVEMLLEQMTADADPILALGDGTDLVGFQLNDSGNAAIGSCIEAADGVAPVTTLIGAGGGSMGTNSRFTELVYRLAPGSTYLYARRGAESAPAVAVASRVLNPEQALKLSFIANDPTEKYGLYSLAVTVTEETP